MTDAQDAIRAAAGRAIDARLDLADVIRAHCPGLHVYVQHDDGWWCDACGYTEHGNPRSAVRRRPETAETRPAVPEATPNAAQTPTGRCNCVLCAMRSHKEQP